jgi:hypothetical protein
MSPLIDFTGRTRAETLSQSPLRVDVASDISRYSDPEMSAEELAEVYYLPQQMHMGGGGHISSVESAISTVLGFPFDSIRRAIASNPNAPVALLADAALSFPEEVAGNPALPFLLIEDPNLRQFPTRAIKQVLKYANASIMNALVKILGQRAPEVGGRHFDILIEDEARPLSQEDWKRLLQEEY